MHFNLVIFLKIAKFNKFHVIRYISFYISTIHNFMLFHFAFSGKIIFSKKMKIQKKIIIDN